MKRLAYQCEFDGVQRVGRQDLVVEARVDHGGLWPVRAHQVDGLGVVLLALGGAVGNELAWKIILKELLIPFRLTILYI